MLMLIFVLTRVRRVDKVDVVVRDEEERNRRADGVKVDTKAEIHIGSVFIVDVERLQLEKESIRGERRCDNTNSKVDDQMKCLLW